MGRIGCGGGWGRGKVGRWGWDGLQKRRCG